MREGCLGMGRGAEDGLSGDFLCLSLGVTSIERGLGVLVGPWDQGRSIWGAVSGRAMGGHYWGQGVEGPCLCWGARQHLHLQGQAPAARWRGTQLQTDILIMDNELLINGEGGACSDIP